MEKSSQNLLGLFFVIRFQPCMSVMILHSYWQRLWWLTFFLLYWWYVFQQHEIDTQNLILNVRWSNIVFHLFLRIKKWLICYYFSHYNGNFCLFLDENKSWKLYMLREAYILESLIQQVRYCKFWLFLLDRSIMR